MWLQRDSAQSLMPQHLLNGRHNIDSIQTLALVRNVANFAGAAGAQERQGLRLGPRGVSKGRAKCRETGFVVVRRHREGSCLAHRLPCCKRPVGWAGGSFRTVSSWQQFRPGMPNRIIFCLTGRRLPLKSCSPTEADGRIRQSQSRKADRLSAESMAQS